MINGWVRVGTGLTVPGADDRARQWRWRRRRHSHFNAPIRFVLMLDGSEAIVGTVGFHTISVDFGISEVAHDIAPSRWGQGFATTVLGNLASQRVLDKVGFKREGPLRNVRLVRGQPAN